MDLSLSSRFKNAWNAFRNRAPTMMSQNIGSGYSYRPDRFRLTRGNERSIVTSVYNRIALDVILSNPGMERKNRTAHTKALSIYITTSLRKSVLANFLVVFVCVMTGLGVRAPGLR